MTEEKFKIIKSGKLIPEENLIWSDCFIDNIAGIKAFNDCCIIGDVMEDKEPRFICADFSSKLRIFKKDALCMELKLQYSPVGLVFFYGINPSNTKTSII